MNNNSPEEINQFLSMCKLSKNNLLSSQHIKYIRKFIKEGEIFLKFSRVNKKYCLGYVSSKNEKSILIFFKREKNKLSYLYDSIELIKDYESNHFKFKKFTISTTDIYIHLAISYLFSENSMGYCSKSIEEYIIQTPEARGENIINELSEHIILFVEPRTGYLMFSIAYQDLFLYNETAQIFMHVGDYYKLDDDHQHHHFGCAFLIKGLYEKAAEMFSYVIDKEDVENNNNYLYYWSLGMKNWKENNKNKAIDSFMSAMRFSDIRSSDSKLMVYLINTINSNKDIVDISIQYYLRSKWASEYFTRIDFFDKNQSKSSSEDLLISQHIKSEMLTQIKDIIKEEIYSSLFPKIEKKLLVLKENSIVKTKPEKNDFLSTYLLTNYEFTVKIGPKRKGLLLIDDKIVQISPIESDLIVTMVKQSKDDWRYLLVEEKRDPDEVGWVSYEDFKTSVKEWMISEQDDHNVSDSQIIKAIYRLNVKIRKALDFENSSIDLIENGLVYGRSKQYRLKVYPKLIKLEQI